MKLLCVIDSLGSGGAQRQLVSLAIEFKMIGHDVSFLVYHSENFFKNLLDDADINVYEILDPSYTKRLFKIRRFIRSGKYDAVLSFLEAANFICEFAGLPWRNWKLVVGERCSNPNIFKSVKLRFYRWFHLLADYVVSNSNENLKMVRKINPLLPARRCKVIYNMVDLGDLRPAIEYIPYKNGKLNLLIAASHQYLKNAKGLITAIHHLDNKDKQRLKVDWFGDESPDDSLKESKELVQKYMLQDVITFHKATKNICREMQQADTIGLFSFYEGLPNVICEAMALGKPIFSSAVSDIPHILNATGNLIFNPENTEEISIALSYLLSLSGEELSRIGERNREKGYALFSKTKIISEYMNLLQN